MKKIVKERRFFYILTLILLAGFLYFPSFCLADNFEEINIEELGKYLELPDEKVEQLLHSLINIFYSEWINLEGSGYSTAEQMAVPIIMREAIRVQALSHLLVDAPIEIVKGIVKTAVEIAKIVLMKDVGDVLDKIEKETVQRAIEYGMNFLIENEIRVTPGAIEFKYTSQKGEEKIAFFQYVIIYQLIDNKNGKILIRFYSLNFLEPPINKGSYGMAVGMYTELTHDLPPFTVDIRGTVEDYKWVGNPSMNIDFSSPVPDLGIKPLSFWEKQILKPIETTIKEIEIIITKITGKSLGLVDIWNEIESFISKIKSFSPAGLVETSGGGLENISNILNLQTEKLSPDNLIEVESQSNETEIKQEQKPEQELTLEEMQEILDDIAERIDILNQQVADLVEVRLQRAPKIEEIEETEEIEDVEEIEELEESELAEETAQVDKIVLCEKIGQPARNKVIFNEIAWMGRVNSANDEWIELKNISGTSIDLTSWQILDKENQIKVIFASGKLFSANGILLLERTDDDSVPGVTADLIYAGILNNTDETLYFFDQNCQLQDEVSANPNWPAGDNSSKRTMERKYDLIWQTSQNPGGTPKTENSSGYIVQTTGGGGGGGSVSTPPQQTPAPSSTSSSPQILITEVQIASVSSNNDEFIELYNPNNQEVDISSWSIQKSHSTSTVVYKKNFETGNKIPAKGYFLIVYASSTDQNLLNLADFTHKTFNLAPDNTIYLAANQEKIENASDADIINMVGFGENVFSEGNPAPEPQDGESIGRKWSSTAQNYIDTNNNQTDFEIQSPTPKAQNQSPQPTENQLPIAQFIYSPANPIVNQEIIFDASSSTDSDGTIASYIWDFGDNTTSTEIKATTTHNYSTSSDFLVSLTVVDSNNATGGATTTITIFTPETPTLEVVINEIAWMGTESSANDEWIELYNNTTLTIDLTGWGISKNGEEFIKLSTSTILANGFYLLERTASNTTDLVEDQVYVGVLRNDGEKLELKNASGTLIDAVDCSSGWFAGKASPDYISMERISATTIGTAFTNWASNNLITRNGLDAIGNKINGTPKAENSVSKSQTEISGTVDYSVLTFLGSPYIITNTLIILYGNTLTVEPGVNLKFNDSTGLEVNGTLKAIGEENNKIIFTSSNEPNYWSGIYFTASSANSELNWTEIKYGRRCLGWGCGEPPAILVENSSIIFKNSILENYTDRGLKLVNSSSTVENTNFLGSGIAVSTVGIEIEGGSPIIKDCDLIQNNKHGIFVDFLAEGDLPHIEGNNFEGNENAIYTLSPNIVFKNNRAEREDNQINGILVSGTISQNLTWFKNDIPYLIENFVIINSGYTLTINPGVIIKGQNVGFYAAYLRMEGKLIAEGTVDNPIVFTSFPDAGNWGGLTFVSGSEGSILKNVIVSYGGAWNPYWDEQGLVSVQDSKVEFDQVTIEYGSEAGLYFKNSESIIKNTSLKNNLYGIYIIGVCPIVENLTFEGNTYKSYSSNAVCNQQMNICSDSLCP